jgi:hypothetical protein
LVLKEVGLPSGTVLRAAELVDLLAITTAKKAPLKGPSATNKRLNVVICSRNKKRPPHALVASPGRIDYRKIAGSLYQDGPRRRDSAPV